MPISSAKFIFLREAFGTCLQKWAEPTSEALGFADETSVDIPDFRSS